MLTRTIAVVISLALIQATRASVYLVGAQLYSSTSTGANSPVFPPYQFSTNSNTGHYPFPFAPGGGMAVAVTLSPGSNVFTFSTIGMSAEPLGAFAGLNLFFADSATSFNPIYAGSGTPGNLSVVTPSDGSGLFTVIASGVNVQAFETDSGTVYDASANGLASWSVGGGTVSVSDFRVTALPGSDNYLQGSFTLNVVPAPGTAALVGVGIVGIRLRPRRR